MSRCAVRSRAVTVAPTYKPLRLITSFPTIGWSGVGGNTGLGSGGTFKAVFVGSS